MVDLKLLDDTTTTDMPVNFDYICDFIVIFNINEIFFNTKKAWMESTKARITVTVSAS